MERHQPYQQEPLYQQGFRDGKRKQENKMLLIFLPLVFFAFILGIGFGGSSEDNEQPTTSVAQTIEAGTDEVVKGENSKPTKKEYKKSCKDFSFKDVSRNPDKYKGNLYKVTGEVIQVQESSANRDGEKSVDLRINVTKNKYDYWEDTIYISYTLPSGADRILEDDIITVYGECNGSYTYKSIVGSSVTLPKITAKYIELKSE